MATLNTTLTLASTDATSDTLSMTVTDSLTIGAPSTGLSKIAIAVSSGTASVLVPAGTENQYVYIKHTGFQADGSTATANEVCIELGGNTDLLRLRSGEFCFFASKSSAAVEALSSSTSTILVEYAYWTRA